MSRIAVSSSVFLVAALLACESERNSSPSDAALGDVARADGGADADSESDPDASSEDAADDGGGSDAAEETDAAPECPEVIITPIEGRPCDTEMRDCVAMCEDSACLDSCVGMATGTCKDCMDRALISCINRNGCQELWDCNTACIRTHCPGDRSDECREMHCATEDEALGECIDATLSACGTRYLDCIPE
jgi:hypothetical protein